MARDKTLFVYVATYDNADDARADYAAVKQLHKEGLIGSFDDALVTRDEDGKVHVHDTEKPTENGIAAGAIAGAIVGLVFPPFLLADAAIGALAGGVFEHLRNGLPHKDLKEIGQTLQDGTAAVVVVAESRIDQALANAERRAAKTIEKQVNVDAKEFDKELNASIKAANQGG